MHKEAIRFCGEQIYIVCDGKCNKAWGIQFRPKLQLDEKDPDDYAFLSDSELGEAPPDPGTYEGGHAKPSVPGQFNKWCARECERSSLFGINEERKPNDFSMRVYNIKR